MGNINRLVDSNRKPKKDYWRSKKSVTEMKTAVNSLISRLNLDEEGISELEDMERKEEKKT